MSYNEYVLGTGADELERLRVQHDVWTEDVFKTWARAGLKSNSRILDLGCGPGYVTFDMAKVVGPDGIIVAADESQNFLNFVQHQAAERGLKQIHTIQADAQKLSESMKANRIFAGEFFDFVYARWLLCWLPDPRQCLHEVYKILKPGGSFIIYDYFNWTAMTLAPKSAALDMVVQAANKSFLARQGNINIAGDLPRLLRAENFHITYRQVNQKIAWGGPGDNTRHWILTWWRTYAPKLVSMGLLEAGVCSRALDDLNELERNPDAFFVCPTLFEFIATK